MRSSEPWIVTSNVDVRIEPRLIFMVKVSGVREAAVIRASRSDGEMA